MVVAHDVRLGTPTEYLDLCGTTYLLRGIDMPDPPEGALYRPVSAPLDITAATADALWAARAALQRMLDRAADAHRDRQPAGERVALALRLGTTGWTYVDVVSGTLGAFEHHPTGISASCTLTLTCLPLLRTDAVTAENRLVAPCDPTATAWTRTNVTATADVATAPDGSLTAARLRETVATGTHEIRQQITKPAAARQYTGSVYVKPDGRTAVALYLADSGGTNGAYAGFSLSGAGSLLYPPGVSGSGFSGAAATITDVGGGWYRVALTATSNADTGLRLYAQCHNGASTSYAGDTGKGLLVWGAQLEEGAGPGLLLVPEMLPDTVWPEHTTPGYEYDVTDYSADPDNLWSGGWTKNNLTETGSQADVTGGTGALRFTDSSTLSQSRWVYSTTGISLSGLPKTYTFAVYIQNYAGRDLPKVGFSTAPSSNPDGFGAVTAIKLSTMSFPAGWSNGSGVTGGAREIIDCGNGWAWVKVTATVSSGSTLSAVIAPSGSFTGYTGDTSKGIVVFRPQIVLGSDIDKPITHVVVPDTVVPEAVTPGKRAGAYLYGIPGDAPALLRYELDDASGLGDAVNRVHLGGWSGRDVRLRTLAPFTLLDAAAGAEQSTGSVSQVGTWVPTLSATPLWQTIATMPVPAAARGRFDAVLRARDTSSNLGAPVLRSVVVAGGIYARQVARVTNVLAGPASSLSLGIPATTPGSTLVLFAQAMGPISPPATMAITGAGGLTWSVLHTPTTGRPNVTIQAWRVENAGKLTSELKVGWSASIINATVALIEIVGAATSSVDQTASNYLNPRDADTLSGTASVTTTQAAELLLSAGLGLSDWSQAYTVPMGDSTWYGVSSLTSGAIYAKSVATTGTYSARWMRFSIDRGVTPPPESWLVTLASFKAANPTGANIGAGKWSIAVTAVDANGIEGAVSQYGGVDVVATSSSVAVRWDAPTNGTPDSYRVYRNRGTGWAYATVAAPATSYTFLSEGSLTGGSPPTAPPVVAAWRLAVALPSGETLWHGRAIGSARANGPFEDIGLGSVALPPTVAGEDTTPEGTLLAVQVAHQTGAPVGANGLWLYEAQTGQAALERRGVMETEPRDWIVDTNRDERLAGWLEDAGDEAGHLVQAVPGALTVQPGNALLVVRPQVEGGISDLVAADLRIRRVLVTPRWRYIAGPESD